MKINKYKDWEDKFFEGEELTPEDELFLKNNIDHPYFSFLEEEKKENLDISFDEFLSKTKDSKEVTLPIKNPSIRQYWLAASLTFLLGVSGFWMFKNENTNDIIVSATEFSEPVLKNKSVIKLENSKDGLTRNDDDENVVNQIVKVEVEKSIQRKKRKNEIQHKKTESDQLDENIGAQDYDPNYVIVNGKPIYNEDDAIFVTENALNYFASNVTQTLNEAEVTRDISKNLNQIINF